MFLKKETHIFATKMKYKFRAIFLEEAKDFFDDLDEKARDKIFYNIWKARGVNDKELFKKLQGEIWEFRTLYNKFYYRVFAFWDKTTKEDVLVVSTHGIVKKTDKIQQNDIDRAERLRINYFNEKGLKK